MATLAPTRRRPPAPPASSPFMPADPGVLRLSEEAYLARERDPARSQERKSELHAGGVVREMSGVSRAHGLIATELAFQVRGSIGPDDFEMYSGEMKFRPPACRYFYPDVMVLPSPPRMRDEERDVMLNPVFVAEVLSESTEAVDRGEKFDCYLNTPSVREYWMIAQGRVRIERWSRADADAEWREEVYEDRAAAVPLPALGGAVAVGALYRKALPG